MTGTDHSEQTVTELRRLAAGVLIPAVGRTVVPRWVEARIADGVGGFIPYGRNITDAAQVRTMTARLHELRDHVLVAIDEEGGDVNRLEDAGGISVPGNRALGRLDDLDATREAAFQIGLSLVEAGVDWDLAPAVDAAVNPLSPNGIRCFGADRDLVSRHAAAWVEGLQAAGVSACAKHYPGHGASGTDAHLGSPRIDISREELLESYLDPFRAAIAAGVDSIMVSHDLLPQVDDVPATISHELLTVILRGELGYEGVIITDALEMAGIHDVAPLEVSAPAAIAAGADALCLGSAAFDEDTATAIDAIVAAVHAGTLSVERLRDANARLARLGTRPRADLAARDASIGERLAERVTEVDGDVALHGERTLVVELQPTHSPAAGRAGSGIVDLLRREGREVETITIAGGSYNGAAAVRAEVGQFRGEFGDAGDVVLLVRSPHRFEWQRPLVDALLSAHPGIVAVDMGVPELDLSGFRGWIRTYGASRVCAQAAVRRLLAIDREPAVAST
jgi:beta-N-acetylhexosaminidase